MGDKQKAILSAIAKVRFLVTRSSFLSVSARRLVCFTIFVTLSSASKAGSFVFVFCKHRGTVNKHERLRLAEKENSKHSSKIAPQVYIKLNRFLSSMVSDIFCSGVFLFVCATSMKIISFLLLRRHCLLKHSVNSQLAIAWTFFFFLFSRGAHW